jgi:hypothetical protein
MKMYLAIIASLLLTTAAFAQPRPPGPAPEGGPPGDRGGPPGQRGGGGGDSRPGPGMDDDRGPGSGMGFGSSSGSMDPRMAKFEMLRGYLDAVDRYARLTRDPANSGIAAVVAANDILRPRGADVAIEYFNKLLPEVKTPAVQRAIRITLVDLYKTAGKQEQALEQLRQLMTADTSGEPSMAPPPPQPPQPGR